MNILVFFRKICFVGEPRSLIVLLHPSPTSNRNLAILVVQVPNGTHMQSPSELSFGPEVVLRTKCHTCANAHAWEEVHVLAQVLVRACAVLRYAALRCAALRCATCVRASTSMRTRVLASAHVRVRVCVQAHVRPVASVRSRPA